MALILESCDDADPMSKDLVCGYLRLSVREFNFVCYRFPDAVSSICLCFYFIGEEFAKIERGVRFSNENKIITQLKDEWSTAHGHMIINPSNNTIYEWKFKILNDKGINVGISGNNKNYNKDVFDKFIENEYYGWTQSGTIYMKSNNWTDMKTFDGDSFTTNDIISMKLDFSNKLYGLLSFKKGKDSLFKKIPHKIDKSKDMRFKMTVTLYFKSSIQLLSTNLL